jgi:hypothetical protein
MRKLVSGAALAAAKNGSQIAQASTRGNKRWSALGVS